MYRFEKLKEILFALTPIRHFVVAYSGGLDSQVLLHSLYRLREIDASIHLRAIHVNHNLSPNADEWAKQCEKNCVTWDIPCQVVSVQLDIPVGASLEAAAREKRYEIFSSLLQSSECLVTAHTQTDQAETLLLQLMRGAGVRGLSAMPLQKNISASALLLRPLLTFTRAQLQQYAEHSALTWIEDESNLNLRFDRNYVRHQIFPALTARWPEASKSIAQTAALCSEAELLLNDLADSDLRAIWNQQKNYLMLTLLRQHSPYRQRNILRRWLQLQNVSPPPRKQLLQIQNELLSSRRDAKGCVKWNDMEVRVYQDQLYLLRQSEKIEDVIIPWNLCGSVTLPMNIGRLVAEPVQGGGLSARLRHSEITIRFRQGGESCQPDRRIGKRSLKKLFQEWQVPPWMRDRIPLIFYQEQLIAVVGYCVCNGYIAASDEEGVRIQQVVNTGI